MIMVTWVTESNNYSLDIVYAMLRDASAILTGTTHKSSPLISEVVTYMYSQYTFYGRIFYFLTMPSSSSAIKTLPSCACTTHHLISGRASLQKKTPLLKFLVTCKKQVTPSKKSVITYLKDPTQAIKNPKPVYLTPPPSPIATNGKPLAACFPI